MSTPTRLSGPPVPRVQPDPGEAPADHQIERYPKPAIGNDVIRRDQGHERRADEHRKGRDSPELVPAEPHSKQEIVARMPCFRQYG
jgi:hypothetical protein